jgi:hypothetical protein
MTGSQLHNPARTAATLAPQFMPAIIGTMAIGIPSRLLNEIRIPAGARSRANAVEIG